MATTITVKVPERSTIVFTMAFTDTAGDAVTPTAITWTLSQEDGTAVNSRTDVPIATPAASNDIVLSGDDTAVIAGAIDRRILTGKAVYDSTEGTGLPSNAEAEFWIEPLVNVT